VVDIAHMGGVSVEGELGVLGSLETGMGDKEDGHGAEGKLSHDQLLTDPDEAVKFVKATKVDALAIAMGTSHGAYKFSRKPDGEVLAMNVIEEIHKKLPNVHLVMHGSSSVPQDLQDIINKFGGKMKPTWGVPVEEIQRGIRHGVRKINIDTDNRMAITGQIRKVLQENPGEFDPRKYLKPALEAMSQICRERLEQFGSAWSVYLAGALHMAPRFGLVEVWPKLWRQVSVPLVLKNLIGTIRHLVCGVGNGRQHGANHCASTLRHAGDHATNQAHTRNRNLAIERHCWCWKWLQQAECAREPAAQIASRHDRIDETRLQQELAALEANRQFVANGASRDARATETDECIRFGNVQVAECAERGDGAAGGWVGQHANKGAAAQLQSRDGGERLWQLHQRVGPLLHAGAARCGHAHEGHLLFDGSLHATCKALAHDRAHRAAHELELEGGYHHRQ
jgi:fructose/tagatose bisphosphate aldolase